MLVVGLTGGIASGKSTIAKMFSDRGIPLICADELARKAVEPGSSGLKEIERVFGNQVLDREGRLDREAMAEIVFRDPSARKHLESIIHPFVASEKERIIGELEVTGHTMVLVDVPLLYESGWEKSFDLIIVVYAPRDLQACRLVQRDKLSPDQAQARLAAQMDIEDKKNRADIVIDNTGDLEHTCQQVTAVLKRLETVVTDRES
jgi:dephospho-CoA kinase